jgi:hypothetical protein
MSRNKANLLTPHSSAGNRVIDDRTPYTISPLRSSYYYYIIIIR